jgi:hypothetical protein
MCKDPWKCTLCRDNGIHRHTGEWSFCGCRAGVARQAANPSEVKDANIELERFEGKFKR